MGRVFVLGSINRDIVVSVPRIPRPGETVLGGDFAEFPGGKGANQAVAAARMGADVALIGATGNDAFGTAMRDFLEREGINTTRVVALPDVPTGIALIAVDAKGENAITVSPGANGHAGASAIASLGLGPGDYLICQFEIPMASVLEAFRLARATGARTILNPAPMRAVAPDLLKLIDFLVLNEHELAQCAGYADPSEDADRVTAMAEMVRSGGSPDLIVIATLGAEGCLSVGAEGTIRIRGERVDAIDTTGAGDCFVGALAALLSQDYALETALRLANHAAALSVTCQGAANSMPKLAEVLSGFSSGTPAG